MKKDMRNLKVYDICNANYERVPMLRLQGKWLKELGFEAGVEISVECQNKRLIISVAHHD